MEWNLLPKVGVMDSSHPCCHAFDCCTKGDPDITTSVKVIAINAEVLGCSSQAQSHQVPFTCLFHCLKVLIVSPS